MTSPYRSQPVDDRHIPEDTAQEIADMAVAEHATDEADLPDDEIRRMWNEGRPADLSDAPDDALSPEWRDRRRDDDEGFIITGVTVDHAVWATTDDPEVATRFRSVLNGLGYTVNVTRDGEDLTDRPIHPETE